MSRKARSRAAAGMLEPGAFYHIVNRGVDHCTIFFSDLDRVVFLSILALACDEADILIHSYCLMDNHFHLLVEDPRGLVSQLMLRLQGTYGQYVNRTKRRSGHLFEGRYRCELVDTPQYFEAVAGYVLLNPLRAAQPLADSAETYRWSSASLSCSFTEPAAWSARFLEPFGGIEGVLKALPPTRNAEAKVNRLKRLEALVAGRWIVGDTVRGQCSPDEYRQYLAARREMPRPNKASMVENEETIVDAARTLSRLSPGIAELPRRAPAHTGLELETVSRRIEKASDTRFPPPLDVPGRPLQRWRVRAYLLWRFTSATLDEVSKAVARGVGEVKQAIEAVRRARNREQAWEPTLWRLEWHLRLSLRAAPWRG